MRLSTDNADQRHGQLKLGTVTRMVFTLCPAQTASSLVVNMNSTFIK